VDRLRDQFLARAAFARDQNVARDGATCLTCRKPLP
jgi:hypothetical protein